MTSVATDDGGTVQDGLATGWRPWGDRLCEWAPVSSVWVTAGIVSVALIVLLVMSWLTGDLSEYLQSSRGLLDHRDARIAVILCAFMGFLPVSMHYQTDLADRLGMRKAATGTLIEGLEGKGLVERRRSHEDRRLQLVSITDAGRHVVDEVDHMAAELGTECRRGITRSERLQLVSALQRLRDNLRRMDATGESSAHG